MRRAGRLAAETLDFITPHVQPGVTTGELDRAVPRLHRRAWRHSPPLNYRGFPKSICTSINHVVCHGIPGDKRLQDGDIVNIDVTVIVDGWHGDTSRMFGVGKVGVKAQKLIDVTYDAMMRGIEVGEARRHPGRYRPRHPVLCRVHRFSVVRDFCGHGIGKVFHDSPSILHFGRPGDRAGAARGHVLHRRADDQCRPLRGEGAGRRLDRRHPRPLAVRPVRAHGRRDRRRLRDLHASPAGLDRPRPSPAAGAELRRRVVADDGDDSRIISAIASVCATAS